MKFTGIHLNRVTESPLIFLCNSDITAPAEEEDVIFTLFFDDITSCWVRVWVPFLNSIIFFISLRELFRYQSFCFVLDVSQENNIESMAQIVWFYRISYEMQKQ